MGVGRQGEEKMATESQETPAQTFSPVFLKLRVQHGLEVSVSHTSGGDPALPQLPKGKLPENFSSPSTGG